MKSVVFVVHLGATVNAVSVLVHPQIESLTVPDGLLHPFPSQTLSIDFPVGIKRVVIPLDLLMPNNFRVG
jgi:hypothetical protein